MKSSGGVHGKGGVKAACSQNPNKSKSLNDTPDGPGAHHLGYTDDGGYSGDQSVEGAHGGSFRFK